MSKAMNTYAYIILCCFLLVTSCSDGEKKKPFVQRNAADIQLSTDPNGVGPVSGLQLSDAIDDALVKKGKAIYDIKCIACHKTHKKFIGPALHDVLGKRAPSWIMNMIINPEKMIKHDAQAAELKKEYKGALMLNQNISEPEARAILEYMRTLK